MSDEKRPFLDDAGEDESLRGSHTARSDKNRTRVLAVSVFANAVLLAVCTLLSVAVLFFSSSSNPQTASHGQIVEPYSPANDIIKYEYRSMSVNHTAFIGQPGPYWEQSWHDLLEGTLIRVSEDELKLSGSESIPLKDGGYAAGLGVAHNLHCVKKIKMLLYREHFYPDLDSMDGEFERLRTHVDLCLDAMRQDVMCYLDYSMYPLQWGENSQIAPSHRFPKVQKCVNWAELHKWMLGRMANSDMLVGP